MKSIQAREAYEQNELARNDGLTSAVEENLELVDHVSSVLRSIL